MKKANIVKKSYEFEKIINKNKKVQNNLFVIYYDLNPEQKTYRFGISAGKKLGNAVVRNKIKRQLRMIIDQNKDTYENNINYIIISKKDVLVTNFEEMNKRFLSLITKIKEETYEK